MSDKVRCSELSVDFLVAWIGDGLPFYAFCAAAV